MSAREARAESRRQNLAYERALLDSNDATEEWKATHTHLFWWLPEILALVAGMLCLLGKFNMCDFIV